MRSDEPTPGASNVAPPVYLSAASREHWDVTYPLAILDEWELEQIRTMASEVVLTVKQEMATMWM